MRLEPPHWRIDPDALAAAIGPKTRAILINTPLNPAGTVMDEAEQTAIAEAAIRHDLMVISDEVWEEVVFDALPFRSIMALPGMRTRTVKIGSAGKMFSMTGWKIGFVCAAPALMQGLAKAHQFLTFTTPPNLQTAVAYGLREERAFLAEQRARLQQSRDRFVGGLRAIGFETLNAQATYFCSIALPASAGSDADFCLGMVRGVGVAAIPFQPSTPNIP